MTDKRQLGSATLEREILQHMVRDGLETLFLILSEFKQIN